MVDKMLGYPTRSDCTKAINKFIKSMDMVKLNATISRIVGYDVTIKDVKYQTIHTGDSNEYKFHFADRNNHIDKYAHLGSIYDSAKIKTSTGHITRDNEDNQLTYDCSFIIELTSSIHTHATKVIELCSGIYKENSGWIFSEVGL